MNINSQIGIVGAGTMGLGIAHTFAQHGYSVLLVDQSNSILNHAISVIEKNMIRQVNKQIISEEVKNTSLDNISLSMNLDDLKRADLVIEAVSENLKIKSEIFTKLDNICKNETILASNTSILADNCCTAFTKGGTNC